MQLIEVEATAVKKMFECQEKLTCLLYVEALGLVAGHIRHDQQTLSHVMHGSERGLTDYTEGVSLHLSGHYDVYTKNLEITAYSLQ